MHVLEQMCVVECKYKCVRAQMHVCFREQNAHVCGRVNVCVLERNALVLENKCTY